MATQNQELGMSVEKQKEKARDLFNKLDTLALKYGSRMQITLKELDFNQVLSQVNEEEKMLITFPKEVQIISLTDLNEKGMENYFEGLIKKEENKFTALHYAILNDTKIILIPKNTTLKEPITIYSKISKHAKAESVIIIAEQDAHATIIEQSSATEQAYYRSQMVQIYAKENASVKYCTVQNLSETSYNIMIKRGKAERNAQIHWLDATLGGKFTQLHIQTKLTAPGAQAKKIGLYFGRGTQIFDINEEAIHESKQTKSSMYNRGVLNENARLSYRGRINIKKESQNCIAQQKSDNLLLGEDARCDAVPILEVENDDIICSHGVTIGHLDEEKLFYLISRGLEEETAKKIAVCGFLEPVINEFPGEAIQEEIRESIAKKIGHETRNED